MNRKVQITSLVLSLTFFSTTILADSSSNKRVLQSDSASVVENTIDAAVKGGFSELERQVIGKYFQTHHDYQTEESAYESGKKHKKHKSNGKKKGLPPGLAKKDRLPPGLQKQLERNGTLPPGLAKRDLPADLSSQLPPAEEGLERVIADTSVILVDKATGVIKDIIRDIVK